MAASAAITKSTLLAIIDAYTGSISDVKIGLFSNNVVPTVDTVLADLTECTFTGYSAVNAGPWNDPAWASQGAAIQYATPAAVFNTVSPYTVGEVVYGWFITAGMTPVLLVAGTFASPVPMNAAGDQIIIGTPLGIADALIPATQY